MWCSRRPATGAHSLSPSPVHTCRFTLKAKNKKTGAVDEGYVFEKPIRISMLCTLPAGLVGQRFAFVRTC